MDTLNEKVSYLLNSGFKLIAHQPLSTFNFDNKLAIFSTGKEVTIGFISYFIIIFGIQHFMKKNNIKPFQLKGLFFFHNLLLTVVSFCLLYGFANNLIPMIKEHGILYAMCNAGSFTRPMEVLYYLNYLVKWWELMDTLFLVLKRKKLEFLHVYHHSFTMVLCYVELAGRVSVSWVVITLNLAVHVIMYYYYARTSIIKKRVWWKQYLTSMQIAQFIIDILIIYTILIANNIYKVRPDFKYAFPCAGTDFGHIFGCLIVTSYLFLFIDFFQKTYKAKMSGRKQRAELNKKATKTAKKLDSTLLRHRNKKENESHDSAFSEN